MHEIIAIAIVVDVVIVINIHVIFGSVCIYMTSSYLVTAEFIVFLNFINKSFYTVGFIWKILLGIYVFLMKTNINIENTTILFRASEMIILIQYIRFIVNLFLIKVYYKKLKLISSKKENIKNL